jgi:hypothetical protein
VPPRIASFTGRAEELDKLDAILMHDKPAAVTQAVGRAAVQGWVASGRRRWPLSMLIAIASSMRALHERALAIREIQ